MNFEDELHPWGFFTETDVSQDFQWSRGNGSLSSSTGPPFDHTTFSQLGHYLYIAADQQEVGEVAWLVTPYLRPTTASDDCYTRWFYHMHGRGIGKLTVYIQ